MAICSSSSDIPMISLETSKSILKSVRPSVNDFHSITANHFLYAGEPGIIHFHLLLKTLITNISLIKVKEVNIVHATILFKGHLKDKTLASSYRTISCCPLVAKALDSYLRDLNIVTWNKDQAPTQFLGQGSSHELAALLLTEVIQFSMYTLKEPLFILYLDAKSAFDKVIREILVRDLYFCGTTGKDLVYVSHRLGQRKTFVEWDKKMMGPISDQVGVEQGGVNSGDYYKIYGNKQLLMAQDSCLGVELSRDTVVSAIGQADDTVLLSNNLHSLQNLLRLSLYYCQRSNVELCSDKTVLQAMAPKQLAHEMTYLKEFSPVKMKDTILAFMNSTEHVGIVRSVEGNLPNIMTRISSHTKAISAVLHTGAARGHHANPVAGLRLQQLYGVPVLMSCP